MAMPWRQPGRRDGSHPALDTPPSTVCFGSTGTIHKVHTLFWLAHETSHFPRGGPCRGCMRTNGRYAVGERDSDEAGRAGGGQVESQTKELRTWSRGRVDACPHSTPPFAGHKPAIWLKPGLVGCKSIILLSLIHVLRFCCFWISTWPTWEPHDCLAAPRRRIEAGERAVSREGDESEGEGSRDPLSDPG